WVLKNKRGKAIKPTFISNKFQYALDVTHPGVKQYLKELITFFVNEIGFKYIKIDFVFSTITEDAVFYDEAVTRIEAYREALGIMRAAAGNDVFILGCGAPLMESMGHVNGMRISMDTDPHWARFDAILSRLNILVPGMKHALLNTITRSWMHKKFWINDPDCLMVRLTKTRLTESEIFTEISIIGLSGGQVAISDDLSRLPSERMRLISLIQPAYPEPAFSPDMFVKQLPEVYMVEGSSKAHGTWKVVALVNWKPKKRGMVLDFGQIRCIESKRYHVMDFWGKKYLGTHAGNEKVSFLRIAPHGCKLLRITEDPGPGQPVILGSTLHVVQGALEIAQFKLDLTSKTMTMTLEKHGKNQGTIFVKLPARVLFATSSGPGYSIKDVSEDVYAIEVDFERELHIECKVEMA
nr:hypothetical protein [Candidatus Sigynarchaeota archaeon]